MIRIVAICLLYLLICLLNVTLCFSQVKSAVSQEQDCGVTYKNSVPYFRSIQNNLRMLRKRDSLLGVSQNNLVATTPTVKFSWPLRPNDITDFTYYRMSNYVDLETDTVLRDPQGNYLSGLKDYQCGLRTYDGHNGLDIVLSPYPWLMMFNKKVAVIAAADGIIVGGDDGEYDRNCDVDNIIGPTWGNWLAIEHSDGTISTYIHMKTATVIPVVIGQPIKTGDFIGYVGSAGRSTTPHLHFGIYINNFFYSDGSWDHGDLTEPFNGSCNNSLPSFWQLQKPYNEPSVISIETHNAAPQLYSDFCDTTINLYFDKTFNAGNTVYTRTWLRDWVDGSTVLIQLINPSGTLLSTVPATNGSEDRHRNVDVNFLLSALAPSGIYTVRVTFDSKIWERYFTVGCTQNFTLSGTLTGPDGYIAGNNITTTQVIESGASVRVEFHADVDIVFKPGFQAKSGSTLIADRKGCTGGY
ncbi:MAG: M23 family metallopeptidase [Ferruginibacter sp.]